MTDLSPFTPPVAFPAEEACVSNGDALVVYARVAKMELDAKLRDLFEALCCEPCNGYGSIHSPNIGVTQCGTCGGNGIDPDVYLPDLFPVGVRETS